MAAIDNTMKLLIKFPDGVYNGIKITVKGNIPSNAVRFAINLLCGSSTIEPEDIAFHLCPRFKEGRVVRNSRSHKEFKDEESAGGNPLSPGSSVEIEIECTDSAFKVKLNGSSFCEFKHRLPFDRITHLDVDGDLKLSHISF
ncbi:galectin-5-like [Helicoverpa armigera]|uniref:Galectin n=1 Tax=Helicoverpa armigera TaxID=29058 RepID=A0A2W1BFV4_HELAM|nr:hypothetical protein B5X24_HaOG208478 [Helicoverpa armigera]